ncbi:hypothetical protein ACIQVU_13525 [Lysinibacillus sp. NPDC098008]|uniref:hypothetical protein n=1 Tax=Lysinibacillus sp. NPDC098008 TaxID=3364146 RepID=UPI00380171AF
MLLLVFVSAAYEWVSQKRFYLESYIYYDKNHKLDSVKIAPKDEVKVFLYVSLKGPKNKMPQKIKVSYTDQLDFQIKKSDYIGPDDTNNCYFIFLDKLVPNQKNVDFEISIPIDVANSDAGYGVTITPAIIDEKFIIHKVMVKDFKFNVKEE